MRRRANYRQGRPVAPLSGTNAPVASGPDPSTPSAATTFLETNYPDLFPEVVQGVVKPPQPDEQADTDDED